MTPSRHLPLILILFASLTTSAQEWPGIKDSVYSNAIGEMRKIQVILPKDYKQGSGKTYEVLYMPDGEWYMEQVPFIYNFVASSHYAPANIFVLIPNTYRNGRNIRDRDYSPVKIAEDSITGGADNYHKFLKDELIPYVEKKYPANGQRTLVGSSFSGLFAIYAYFKDPMLFNSYVASDPNLSFGNNYVPKLATERLPQFDKVTSTLFFAGLKISSRGMGSYTLDSIMKRSAPATLLWKYIEYADETHYSVQHKAFYDGMRYSHYGYAEQPVTIHPMGGVLTTGKAIQIAITGNPVNVRYTTDGSKPTPESPLLEMGAQIPGPGLIRIQSFPNRLSDARSEELTFKAPPVALKKSSAKTGSLTYELYDGTWNSFPDIRKMKPSAKGTLAKDAMLSRIRTNTDAAYVVDGTMAIDQPGYYVFASFGAQPVKVTVGGHTFFNTAEYEKQEARSYVLPLETGIYPIRVESIQKAASPDFAFSVFYSASPDQRWWEHRVFGF